MNYSSLNRLFTFVCFVVSPVLGSVLSFVWHGGALWCLFEIATGKRKFSKDRQMIVLSIFMYLYVVTNLISLTINYGEPYDIFTTMRVLTFALFPFSYSIWSMSRKIDIARACVFGSAIACYGGLILALYQYYYLDIRAEGGAGNAIIFAQVVAIASATTLAAAFSFEKDRSLFLVGAFLAGLLAIVFSQSRSSWVILIIESIVVLFVYRKAVRRSLSMRIVLCAVAVAVMIYLVAAPLIWSRMHLAWMEWKSLEDFQNYHTSLGMRVALWQIGLDLFQAHPFAGYGISTMHDLLRQTSQSRFNLSVGFSHFHNGFLTLLVQCGIIGAASIVAIFVTAIVIAVRTLRRSVDEIERFGGVMLLMLAVSYIIAGCINILIGHDILDTTLMILLIVGSYLAAGTSALPAQHTAQAAMPVTS